MLFKRPLLFDRPCFSIALACQAPLLSPSPLRLDYQQPAHALASHTPVLLRVCLCPTAPSARCAPNPLAHLHSRLLRIAASRPRPRPPSLPFPAHSSQTRAPAPSPAAACWVTQAAASPAPRPALSPAPLRGLLPFQGLLISAMPPHAGCPAQCAAARAALCATQAAGHCVTPFYSTLLQPFYGTLLPQGPGQGLSRISAPLSPCTHTTGPPRIAGRRCVSSGAHRLTPPHTCLSCQHACHDTSVKAVNLTAAAQVHL